MKIAGVIIIIIIAVCTAKHNILPSSLANDMPLHFLRMHGFFFLPSPPNLGMSLQKLHWPQSFILQPVQCPHLLRLFAVGNKYSLQLKLLGPNHYRYVIFTLQCCAFIVPFFISRKGVHFGCMIVHKQKVRRNGHSRWSNHCSILDTLHVSG